MGAESITNKTERVIRNFGTSRREVLLIFALVLAVSTKSYVIQEMLFWLGFLGILFAVVILAIAVSMALRRIGRAGYRWTKVAVANMFADVRNRLAHHAMGQLPHR